MDFRVNILSFALAYLAETLVVSEVVVGFNRDLLPRKGTVQALILFHLLL